MPVISDPEQHSSSAGIQPSFQENCGDRWIKLRGLRHLAVVLAVSLAHPISGSTYVLLGGTVTATTLLMQHYRLASALVMESASLLLLWYVISVQGRKWADIGLRMRYSDIPHAIGLFLGSAIVASFAAVPVQYFYRSWTGHWLVPKDLHPLLGFGMSFLSLAFAALNPFFEELIVRGFTMSEIMGAGFGQGTAIVVSVVLQMSYHLYQGAAHAIALTVIFTVYSIYYAQTRKIMPVILAHLAVDMLAVIRGF